MQHAMLVVQTKKQRPHCTIPGLVPAKTGDHAFRCARMLHLDHRALPGLIGKLRWLGNHAVEPGSFEALKPFGCELEIAGDWCDVHRGPNPLECSLQFSAAFALWGGHQAAPVCREQIECDK